MGQSQAAYLVCTRITLETTALRANRSDYRIRTVYHLCTHITLETTALRVTVFFHWWVERPQHQPTVSLKPNIAEVECPRL